MNGRYGCGCNTYDPCGNSCPPMPTNSPRPATVVYAQNTWNIPSLNETAELDVPSVKLMQVGGYIWNPNYGKFYIESFNAVTGKLIISNTGFVFNSVSGTIIPAFTPFMIVPPVFSKEGTWTPLMPDIGTFLITIDSVDYADYKVSDDEVFIDLSINFTPSGVAGSRISITPPFACLAGKFTELSCSLENNGAFGQPASAHFAAPTDIRVRRADLAAYTLSASNVRITGSYRPEPI